MAVLQNKYFTVIVTLTNANTNYNLYDLADAIRTVFPRTGTNVGIISPSTNADDILIGDSTLSTTQYGRRLNPGSEVGYLIPTNRVPFEGMYARSATAAQTLQIEIMVG